MTFSVGRPFDAIVERPAQAIVLQNRIRHGFGARDSGAGQQTGRENPADQQSFQDLKHYLFLS
ncbi:hypothetical protein ABZ863_13095 [Saccharomonospora sp. NPDC046836]|uniref:hypothetical protein n=1 Tax=Saccharomonospora sp. NPDC046836 TaxID=3156921 RepID=UPI00340F9E70